ncbi:MAG TPA: MotA/TolQ/ExbB proton channel family protein [Candidatus Ratteibacteria bacterium]|nr:MotA/TolQ/ExbB proton channel family protein [Candidatus Ratteibacteria bacterium]
MGNIWVSSWQLSDWAGKLDIVILLFLSIYSWYIMFYKFFYLRSVERKNNILKDIITYGKKIIVIKCPLFFVLKECKRTIDKKGDIKEEEIEKMIFIESNKLKTDLSFLATIISIAPFLGLLGTVWGLLMAFNNIAATGSASASVISSGVAEALITTFYGLLVAIPAAFGYNYFQDKTEKIKIDMFNITGDIIDYLKRKNE